MTSKPDLYPLVISYGAENGKIGDNYLMVQYFRNYIVRPLGKDYGPHTKYKLIREKTGAKCLRIFFFLRFTLR